MSPIGGGVPTGRCPPQETLRTALAVGADRGVLLEVGEGPAPGPREAAAALAGLVERLRPDLVLLGKQVSPYSAL